MQLQEKWKEHISKGSKFILTNYQNFMVLSCGHLKTMILRTMISLIPELSEGARKIPSGSNLGDSGEAGNDAVSCVGGEQCRFGGHLFRLVILNKIRC